MYTFIIFGEDGYRRSDCVNVDNEDSAWEMIHMKYPDAEYIEMF